MAGKAELAKQIAALKARIDAKEKENAALEARLAELRRRTRKGKAVDALGAALAVFPAEELGIQPRLKGLAQLPPEVQELFADALKYVAAVSAETNDGASLPTAASLEESPRSALIKEAGAILSEPNAERAAAFAVRVLGGEGLLDAIGLPTDKAGKFLTSPEFQTYLATARIERCPDCDEWKRRGQPCLGQRHFADYWQMSPDELYHYHDQLAKREANGQSRVAEQRAITALALAAIDKRGDAEYARQASDAGELFPPPTREEASMFLGGDPAEAGYSPTEDERNTILSARFNRANRAARTAEQAEVDALKQAGRMYYACASCGHHFAPRPVADGDPRRCPDCRGSEVQAGSPAGGSDVERKAAALEEIIRQGNKRPIPASEIEAIAAARPPAPSSGMVINVQALAEQRAAGIVPNMPQDANPRKAAAKEAKRVADTIWNEQIAPLIKMRVAAALPTVLLGDDSTSGMVGVQFAVNPAVREGGVEFIDLNYVPSRAKYAIRVLYSPDDTYVLQRVRLRRGKTPLVQWQCNDVYFEDLDGLIDKMCGVAPPEPERLGWELREHLRETPDKEHPTAFAHIASALIDAEVIDAVQSFSTLDQAQRKKLPKDVREFLAGESAKLEKVLAAPEDKVEKERRRQAEYPEIATEAEFATVVTLAQKGLPEWKARGTASKAIAAAQSLLDAARDWGWGNDETEAAAEAALAFCTAADIFKCPDCLNPVRADAAEDHRAGCSCTPARGDAIQRYRI